MAQLTDDCFAFGGALLSIDAALALIGAAHHAGCRQRDRAAGECGRAHPGGDVVAGIDLPPHANSAVDGFAIAHADLSPDGETVLPVGGRAAAGHPLGRPVRRGEAIRIFTGAPMPEGADTVMMQEDCVVADGQRASETRHPQRRQPAPCRRGCHGGDGRAGGRSAAEAGRSRPRGGAWQCRAAGFSAAAGRAAIDRRRGVRAGGAAAARRDLRRQPAYARGAAVRGSAASSAISASGPTAPRCSPTRWPRPAPGMI